jgi:hypothetical protein
VYVLRATGHPVADRLRAGVLELLKVRGGEGLGRAGWLPCVLCSAKASGGGWCSGCRDAVCVIRGKQRALPTCR